MKDIPGEPVDHSFIDEILLGESDELIYYDGALLSHFKGEKDYLIFYCDEDKEKIRWALVQANPADYLLNKIDLRDTLLSGPAWIFDNNWPEVLGVWKVDQVPEEYLPLPGCFYST